ncbi:uncharacterized protein LOC134265033, partial [Saccostrea cucullata]|uniref:uncharacterized protein LOC134265033 n=1 Tax=Saccostrea cuccullata TaxID=36930 RepID=UPI002ED003B9
MAASSQVNNSQCYFSNFCNVSCSTSKELEESNLLSLHECDKNTSYHLAGLQASERIPGKNAQFYDCPEALLILYRCGIFTIDPRSLDLKICQKHREYFGIRWRRSKTRCSYPEHNGQKSRGDRGANPSLCKEYWLKTRSTLQVGTGICKHCQQFFRSNISEEFKVDFKDEIESFFQVKKLIKKNFAEEICE